MSFGIEAMSNVIEKYIASRTGHRDHATGVFSSTIGDPISISSSVLRLDFSILGDLLLVGLTWVV